MSISQLLFLVLYVFKEIINLFVKRKYLPYIGIVLLVAGIMRAIVSVLSSNLEYQSFLQAPTTTQLQLYYIKQQEEKATTFLWDFLVVLIIKLYFILNKKDNLFVKIFLLFIALFGVYFLLETAYSGGTLVYKYEIETKLINGT